MHQFDRLNEYVLKIVSIIDPAECIYQYGHSPIPQGISKVKASSFLTEIEFRAAIQSADLFVTHAGAGNILQGLEVGLVPLVVPRRPELQEHLDAHQLELTEFLQKKNFLINLEDMDWVNCDFSNFVKSQRGDGKSYLESIGTRFFQMLNMENYL